MVGACLSDLVRKGRATLAGPLSLDGITFPDWCLPAYVSANIKALQDATKFICSLAPKVAENYPQIYIDHTLRLDSWLEEVQELRRELCATSASYFHSREVLRVGVQKIWLQQETKLIAAFTDKALAEDAKLLKAAYIERVCSEARNCKHAVDYTIHLSEMTLARAATVMSSPRADVTVRMLKEVRLLVEIYAPRTTIADAAQFKTLMGHIDTALKLCGEQARLADTMPLLQTQAPTTSSTNETLNKLREKLAAIRSRAK